MTLTTELKHTAAPDSTASNFSYLEDQKNKHQLSHLQIAKLTEYGVDSVTGWFSPKSSGRYRDVPPRAIALFKAKLELTELRIANRKLKATLKEAHLAGFLGGKTAADSIES